MSVIAGHGCVRTATVESGNVLLVGLILLARSGGLIEAVKSGNADAARALLALGADPETCDERGLYPLDYAAFDNRAELARLLLENHAPVNQMVKGSTPLDFAVASGSTEVAKVLIDNGADVRRVYPTGRTPLHIAAAAGHLTTAELLIDRGANVDVRDKQGISPLDLAIANNRPEIVGLLLDAGAVPVSGALHNALRRNRIGLARAMLTHGGLNIDAADASGFTMLLDAALTGDLAAVRILLDCGADINKGDKESGKTALYMAAAMGREDVVTLLLERGADPKKGPSPAVAAKSAGFDKIAAAITSKHP